MASRNAKAQGGGMYDTPEKLQSNTLKRHPKMDLSKTDLLRLLSYLEGELQARDVVIATLKAEKAKQLLYQAKYGRFGLGDPFMALQRDSDNMKDNSFDESAIKAMYDNQLAQLENLIATQRKAQLKMREQLAAAEKRYHKVCNELEDEKRKHAQDTAQGDDVTYMLEKERERLRQEIEYEKSQNKKMEKDLKKTLANLEEERANSIKHKQVAVMLIKEQKKLIEKLVKDRQKINKYEELLREEKDKTTNVVEGLVQESKKSLKMEAAMEKQMSDFEVEKEQLKGKLAKEEFKNRDLACQIEALQHQVDLLQKQLIVEKTGTKDAFQSIEIKSSANPRGSGGSSMAIVSPTVGRSAPRYTKPTSTESSLRITDPPDRGRSTIDSNVQKTRMYGMQPVSQSPERQLVNDSPRVESPELRIAPIGAASIEKPEAYRVGTRVSASSPGGKILTVNVSHPNPAGTASNLSPRKIASASPGGRGTPPPLPPNKPNISSPTPLQQSSKPALPAKIGVTVSKGVNLTGQESPKSSPRGIHIPISVVHSPGTVIPTTSHSSAGADKSASPLRKPAQLTEPVSAEVKINDFNTTHAETLDFLGPEMADLQNLLSSIMSDSDSSHNLDSSKSSSSSSSFPVSSLSSSLSSSDISSSPLHKLAAEGDLEALRKYVLEREADVNLPLKDGSTPLLFAAKYGHCECVKFLLDNGANPATCGDTRFSALHATAAEGHHACVKLLLDHGVNANTADHQNWTPLHMAATHGHLECCRLLLMYGAKLNVCSTTSWTPLHNAVHAGHDTCLDVMLDLYSKQPLTSPGHVTLQQLINIPDNDGWTIYHVAANKNHTKCLDVINKYSAIDVNIQDKWGRTVLDVANQACRQYLSHKVLHKQAQADIFLETRFRSFQGEDNSSKLTAKSYIIGSLQLGEDTKWSELEANLASIVTSYFCQLDTGLKTKRTSRLDPEITSDAIQYTLGLDVKSIHSYEIGTYTWRAGSQNTEKLPYDVMCNSNVQKIVIVLQDSIDTIACDVLFPVSVLHNYLRLLEHYKSVVFYGPEFTGKSYLAGHLANYLATKELSAGRLPSVHTVNLHTDFSHLDLVNTLLQTGCMMQNKTDTADTRSPILILENMETINISQVFGKLLPAIEHRGQYHAFAIDENGTGYYFVDNFYIIATMNKSRSTGLELAVQQRFRWVHFRIDIEPIRNLLARHYQRKFIQAGRGSLPIPDSLTFRAVEWVVCVWQRLNDGVGKLGLHDVVFGPHPFLSCPLESNDPSAIHSWLTVVWNEMIAPSVREAVICGTGRETTSPEGQQKVANTALYVLMQKAVVPGCPLSGVEKEKFLCTFSGSNELELQMRMDKSRTPVNNGHASRRSTGSNVHRSTPHKHKHRSSMGSEEREAIPSSLTSKRRSLSETSLKNSIEYEEKKEDIEAINLSAKVRKLEIRPPAIFQFSSQARPSSPSVRNSLNNESSDMPLRTFSFSATSKSSSVSESGGDYSQTSSSRRSWSTENLSGAGKYGITGSEKSGSKTKSNSPFSFSLTTPTSSLSSFKYLETKSRSDTSQSKIPFRRSLNSIEDQSSKKDSHRSFVVSGLQTNIPRKTAVRNGRSHSYGNSSFPDSNANVKAEDIWIPQGNAMYFSDSETVGRNKSDSSFIRNSKLRKSIEKVSPENMFTDYEGRRSFENGGSPFVRNASSRISIERVSHDSKFFPDQEITTSLNPDRKLSGYPSDLLSVGKGKTGIESEC